MLAYIAIMFFGLNLAFAFYMLAFNKEDGILDDVNGIALFVVDIFFGIFVLFYVVYRVGHSRVGLSDYSNTIEGRFVRVINNFDDINF